MRVLLIYCAVLAWLPLAAADPRFEPVVAAIGGENPAAREAAVAQAPAYAPDAIGALMPLVARPDEAVRSAAREAIGKIAEGAALHPETRLIAGNALLAALADGVDPAWLLDLLGAHGGPEHLDALLALLDGPAETRPATVHAITRIALGLPDSSLQPPRGAGPLRWLARQVGLTDRPAPAPRAVIAAALVARMDSAEPAERAALVDSLGALGEAIASPVLIPLLDDAAHADAAVAALGGIGDSRACAALRERYEQHGGARTLSAYARALDRQPATQATRGFAALLGDANPAAQTLAVQGIARHATSTHFVERIAPFVDAKDAALRGAAEAALVAFEGAAFDRALVRVIRRAPPAQKARLLPLLAARDHGLALAEAAALRDHPDECVRAAALGVLGEAPPAS
jgi:HEAT repeat protein